MRELACEIYCCTGKLGTKPKVTEKKLKINNVVKNYFRSALPIKINEIYANGILSLLPFAYLYWGVVDII